MFKPFKPPLLKSVARPAKVDLTVSDHGSDDESSRPTKKRRLVHVIEDSPPRSKAQNSSGVGAPRKPLLVVSNRNESRTTTIDNVSEGLEGYYMVLW